MKVTDKDILNKTRRMGPVTERPVFERAIYIFKYTNRIFLKLLQKTIIDINLEGLKIENGTERDIRTYKLSDEEKKSKVADYIGGVQFIDKHYRMFILEGLNDQGMKKLQERIPKTDSNTIKFKIMKDPTITFESRLYADFDIDIKKIKLRSTIKDLVAMPSLYLREKVPLEIYIIVNQIKKIREKETIHEVMTSNLWPLLDSIINFERNYGEALNDDDLYGKEKRKKKKSKRSRKTKDDSASKKSDFASEATYMMGMSDLRESQQRGKLISKSAMSAGKKSDGEGITQANLSAKHSTGSHAQDSGHQRNKSSNRADSKAHKSVRFLDQNSQSHANMSHTKEHPNKEGDENSFTLEKGEGNLFKTSKNFSNYDFQVKHRDIYKFHLLREMLDEKNRISKANNDILPQEQIYTTQMRHLREEARKDKNYFYTYSENYMSLSINPYIEKDENLKQEMEARARWVVKNGFNNVPKKDPNDYNKHPKQLHPSQVENLRNHPKHIEDSNAKKFLNSNENDKNLREPHFKTHLPKMEIFNKIKKMDKEKITAVEAEKFREELKNKEKEDWKKRLIVEDSTFHVDLRGTGVKTMDKYKGLLKDKAVKKGLLLPNKYRAEALIDMDEALQQLPISYNKDEKKYTKTESEALTRLDKHYDPKKCTGNSDFNIFPVLPTVKEFVYKPRRQDCFTKKYT